jgi:hypothetical protein
VNERTLAEVRTEVAREVPRVAELRRLMGEVHRRALAARRL